MPHYRFTTDEGKGDINYADYDYVDDLQTYYLGVIANLVDSTDLIDSDDIIREFITQLFIHEDLHECIENLGMETLASAQHETVYKWVKHALSNEFS